MLPSFLLRATTISLEQGDHPRHDSDDDEKGVYLDPYRAAPWLYVTPSDEAKVSSTRGKWQGCWGGEVGER